MATYRYYISRDPSTPSPPSSELSSIEAQSPSDAVARLMSEGKLPPDSQFLWAHVLVWTSDDGQLRGFESTRLAPTNLNPKV
jgi:hypothetical protein